MYYIFFNIFILLLVVTCDVDYILPGLYKYVWFLVPMYNVYFTDAVVTYCKFYAPHNNNNNYNKRRGIIV